MVADLCGAAITGATAISPVGEAGITTVDGRTVLVLGASVCWRLFYFLRGIL